MTFRPVCKRLFWPQYRCETISAPIGVPESHLFAPAGAPSTTFALTGSIAVILLLIGVTSFASDGHAQRNCDRGKPCGNPCIAQPESADSALGAHGRPLSATIHTSKRNANSPARGAVHRFSSRSGYHPVSCDAWRSLAETNLEWYVASRLPSGPGLTRTTDEACGGLGDPAGSTQLIRVDR